MTQKTTPKKRCTPNKWKNSLLTLLQYVMLSPLLITGGASTNQPSCSRPLRLKERNILRQYFGDCIDSLQITVRPTIWIPMGMGLSLGGGQIFLNPSTFEGGVVNGELKLSDPYVAWIVAHETMHVVQANWGYHVFLTGAALIIEDLFLGTNRYAYRGSRDPTLNLERFRTNNIEQQGEQMGDIAFGSTKAGDSSKILAYVKKRCMCQSHSFGS